MLLLTFKSILSITAALITMTKFNVIRGYEHWVYLPSRKSTLLVPNLNKFRTYLNIAPNWHPIFKRSSYIGLVWKSKWQL